MQTVQEKKILIDIDTSKPVGKERFEMMEAARKKFDPQKARDLLKHVEKSRKEW